MLQGQINSLKERQEALEIALMEAEEEVKEVKKELKIVNKALKQLEKLNSQLSGDE